MSPLLAQTILSADGKTDTYKLITNALAPGANPIEVPDSADAANAPHIRQTFDSERGHYVFQFFIHRDLDDDPSTGSPDRQRNEIKTYASSPAYLKGYTGETLTYRWRFKLDAAFQPSPYFTHIHQIKPVDGNDANPVITLTPVAASPNVLQLRYMDEAGALNKLATVNLAPFLGTWVEAYEKLTLGTNGTYSITITRMSDGLVLLSHTEASINLLRTGSSFYRPKWGIYRSLNTPTYLRNEIVLFDRFCLAKGTDDCAPEVLDFTLTPSASSATVNAGRDATYTLNLAPIGSFTGNVALNVTGLPAGATATFNPSTVSAASGATTLTIATTAAVTPGTYSVTVNASSGTLTHTSVLTLTVIPPASFTVTINPATQTLVAGSAAEFATTVTPSYGFSSLVTFSCSGLPASAQCVFTPASVTPSSGQPATSTLSITTEKYAHVRSPQPWLACAFLLPGAVLLPIRKRIRCAMPLLAIVTTLALLGCGGAGGSSGRTYSPNPPSPVSYNVVVTASAGVMQSSATINLAIQ